MSDAETRSKDAFFARVAEVAEEMIAAHGRDFTMGTLILAARFIAEGKALRPPAAPTPAQKPGASR